MEDQKEICPVYSEVRRIKNSFIHLYFKVKKRSYLDEALVIYYDNSAFYIIIRHNFINVLIVIVTQYNLAISITIYEVPTGLQIFKPIEQQQVGKNKEL